MLCEVDLVGMTGDTAQGEAGVSEVGVPCHMVSPGIPHGHSWLLLNSSIPGLEWGEGRNGERKDANWVRAAMEKDGQENRAIQITNILFYFLQGVHDNLKNKKFAKVRRQVQRGFRELTSNVPVITGWRGAHGDVNKLGFILLDAKAQP